MTLNSPTIQIEAQSPYRVIVRLIDIPEGVTTTTWNFATDNGFTNIISTINDLDYFTYVFPTAYINTTLYLRVQVSDGIDSSNWEQVTLSSFPVPQQPLLEQLTSSPSPRISVLATNIDSATAFLTFQVSRTASPNTWDPANIIETKILDSPVWQYRVPYEYRGFDVQNNPKFIHYFRVKVSSIADFDPLSGEELLLESSWSDTLETSPSQIRDKDIESNSITSDAIKPGAIGSAQLKPQIIVGTGGLTQIGAINYDDVNSNQILLEADKGLTFKDKDDNVLMRLPLDPNGTKYFKGNLNAESLYSSQSTLVNNTSISNNSKILLSSGQIKEPLSAPTVTSTYDSSYWITDPVDLPLGGGGGGTGTLGGGGGVHWNLWVDPTGGPSLNTKTAWLVIPYTGNAACEYTIDETGKVFDGLRTISVSGECHAACRVGGASGITSRIFTMFYRSATTMYINAYNTTNLSLVKQQFETVSCYEPTMLPDKGRNNTLLLIDVDPNTLVNNAPTKLRFRSYTIDNNGKITLSQTALSSAFTGFATTDYTSICATMSDNSTIYVSVADTVKEQVLKFTLGRTSGSGLINSITQTSSDTGWTAAWGAAPWGIEYDSGVFWVHDGSNQMYKTNNSNDTSTYEVTYTFRNSAGTATTTLSPARTYARIPYANLFINATQDLPSTTGYEYGFYLKKTTSPAWSGASLQTTSSSTAVTLNNLVDNYLTAPAPSSNTFSGGTPAMITLDSTTSTPVLTISGNGNVSRANLVATSSNINVVATGISGSPTLNIDVLTASIWYYTTNASSDSTLNFRGNSSTSLTSILGIGQNMEIIFMQTNGTIAYKPTTFLIDSSTVTPKWSGGVAPSGNASSVDAYLFNIVKTASSSYTIFARQIRYA